MENQFFHQTKTQCEKQVGLRSLFYRWPQSLQRPLLTTGKRNSRKSWVRKNVVSLDAVVGLFVTSGKTLGVNSRLYCGLILLLVVAPLTNCLYLLFDSSIGFPLSEEVIVGYKAGLPVEGSWYYVNWHYFLSGIGPHLFSITSLVGIFLMFPVRNVSSYSIAIPLGFEVGKVIWLSTVMSDAEFNQIVPSSFLLLGALISFVVMLSARFWMDRKFHKYDGICARILGLINAPGIDPSMRSKYIDQELKNLRDFQSKF